LFLRSVLDRRFDVGCASPEAEFPSADPKAAIHGRNCHVKHGFGERRRVLAEGEPCEAILRSRVRRDSPPTLSDVIPANAGIHFPFPDSPE
jgi:hypothetical protein